jgi:hypothetical protein
MKTLLVIHSYAGAAAQVNWTWPHYLTPGWGILGVTPEDASHPWPPGVRSTTIARNGYVVATNELVKRLVGTFEYVLQPEFSEYSDFCVIEYDGFFLRVPPPHPGGFCSHLAGGGIVGFKATKFFHTPWWADRAMAQIIVEEGKKMMAEGEWEKGAPDFFLGLLCDRRQIVWGHTNTWSVNGGNFAHRKEHAIQPIKNGIWYLHGIRTKAELDWCLNLIPR